MLKLADLVVVSRYPALMRYEVYEAKELFRLVTNILYWKTKNRHTIINKSLGDGGLLHNDVTGV